ncbi:MAG: acetyl-CoA carboxylase biotin carboxyl carrier protein [Acidobacteria bacterium]|nr:acetyl-CoA carboxylase biotin carboxyl carrier protein [Acidobacteriota bacterium]
MGGGRLDSEIKELMEYIEASSFVEFELEREGFKIKLVKRAALTNGAAGSGSPSAQAVAAAAVTQAAEAPAAQPATVESPDLHLVQSPIVGTFYRAGSPTGRSFVEVGDRVKKGQVLCIIEAMKLMNEIESDCDGEILEVLVANGQPVEYGEPLFKIRKGAPA